MTSTSLNKNPVRGDKRNTYLLLLSFITCTFTLNGCIYLRLLEVKKQLNQFNQYFVLEDDRGLVITFREPVLYSDDIIWLMKSAPANTPKNEYGEIWGYKFLKQYSPDSNERGDYDIEIKMLLVEDRLKSIILPQRFLKYFSKELFIKILEAMGNSTISNFQRKASSDFKTLDIIEIPTMKNILDLLGNPYSNQSDGDTRVLVYKFSLQDINNSEKSNTELRLKFFFTQESNKLIKTYSKYRGLTMSINFSLIQRD